MATVTRRKRQDNPEVDSADALRKQLSPFIKSDESAEAAILHIMKERNFSSTLLKQILTGPFILFGLSESV